MSYDPSAGDKQNLREVIQAKAPAELLTGPLRIDLFFYFSRPKAHYGTGRNSGKLKSSAPSWKVSKPDRDNLDKFVLDAMTTVFFKDDSQICDGRIVKQYSERPRTVIFITKINERN